MSMMPRLCCAIAFSLAFSLALSAQSPFEARLVQAEQVLDRFYRGESLPALRERSNREIETFNGRAKAVNAELASAKAGMEAVQAPAQQAYARLQEMDAGLKDIPDGNDLEGNRRYRARLDARNAAARQVNELNAKAAAAIEGYNALVKRSNEALEQERRKVVDAQKELDGRIAAYEAFTRGGQDVAYFTGVNRLLSDLRRALRAAPGDAQLAKGLDRVRAVRRHLAVWAMAEQARHPEGLVVVEVLVEDEPAWLIVDTGAMDVVLPAELAEAAGLAVGAENSLVVVGGQRIQGRQIRIPRLAVGDQALEQVKAYAVQACDVGIDGLLGQSFLKAFVCTLGPSGLGLTRR